MCLLHKPSFGTPAKDLRLNASEVQGAAQNRGGGEVQQNSFAEQLKGRGRVAGGQEVGGGWSDLAGVGRVTPGGGVQLLCTGRVAPAA